MKRLIFLPLVLCLFLTGIANDFKQKADIDSVPQTGFYKVILSPDIVSGLNENYSDFRIYDSRKTEIPYLLYKDNFYYKSVYFREFPIIENSTDEHAKLSTLIIENPNKELRSEIRLIIRNTDAEKEITLKGSDNKKDWYIITKGYPERVTGANNDSSETRVLSFPPSNYAFFKLTLSAKKQDIFQIIKAGFIDEKMAKGAYAPLPAPRIIRKDSVLKSYITLIFEKPYEINRLEWKISKPELFLRHCTISKQRLLTHYGYETIYSQELSSKKLPVWQFETIKTDSLVIIVENNNNIPLQIESINAFQLNIYAITKLEAKNCYTLLFDNQTLMEPEYDLKYFTDQIPQILPEIHCKSISLLDNYEKNIPKKHTAFVFNKLFLWIVLIIIAIGLIVLSVKLLKEIK